MSLNRIKNMFSSTMTAYVISREVYDSTGDFVHGDGYIIKAIYIPEYDLHCHYYTDCEKFVAYKTIDPFNKNDHPNIKEIKISSSFANYIHDLYEMDQETKKWSKNNKEYFDKL